MALAALGEGFSILINKQKNSIADTLEEERKLFDVGKILSKLHYSKSVSSQNDLNPHLDWQLRGEDPREMQDR